MAHRYAILTQYEGREDAPIVLYDDLPLRKAERYMAALRRARDDAGDIITDDLDGFTVETPHGRRYYWIVDR